MLLFQDLANLEKWLNVSSTSNDHNDNVHPRYAML